MSSRTFYEQFSDVEGCFLAAFDHAVAELAAVARPVFEVRGDQGQISRLLRRLEAHGLLQNSGGATAGAANAWCLTLRGEALLHSSSPLGGRTP